MLWGNAYALVTASGKIHDKETGESIPGVAVQVVGTLRGAAANVEGFFSIPDLEPGDITLSFTALGYKSLRKKITLAEGSEPHLKVDLVPEALEFTAVEIETESEERDYSPQVAQMQVTTKELAKLPQLLESDLFRSLQALPGVLPTSDFSSELNIWGGSSDQNLILLNGIDVYKPTHLGGLFSVFNMDAVKDVKLIKGGFGARYGGRLSAVVDVADAEGNRNKFQGKVGLSLLSSSATLQGPLPRGSWLLSGRRTYLDGATKAMKNAGIISEDFPYYFYDLNVKATRDFANGDRLSPSAYLGRDVLDIVSTTDDRIRLTWGNATYSLPYVRIWHKKLFSTNTVAGSFYDSDFRFETTGSFFGFRNKIRDFTMKTDFTYFATARHTFDFGLLAKKLNVDLFIGGSGDTLHDGTYDGWQLATYLSDDIRPTEYITITPGLRVEHNTLSGVTDYLPRLAAKCQLTETSFISAAWGIYSQPLQLLTFGQGFASIFDSYVPLDRSFKPNRGQHCALTYENDLDGPLKVATDVYYKNFERVIEYNSYAASDGSNKLSHLFYEGNGFAYGWDLQLQGDYGTYAFSLGYGLGRSWRKFPDIDEGERYATNFDRLHNMNLFASRKVRKRGSLEMRFNYGTGQPITKAVGAYTPGLDLPPIFFVPGKRNNYRVPPYHRLDIAYRLRYEYKHWTLSPFIEIINLYNNKNVLTLDYDVSTNPAKISETGQLPFLPSIGVTAEF
jgi:hypothetical protein